MIHPKAEVNNIKIAIDGPAGAGKSTVAKDIAKKLGFLYIDTGAMYRALTYLALKKGLDLSSEDDLSGLAENSEIRLVMENNILLVLADGEDATEAIRRQDVSSQVSTVSALPLVREPMVRQQRKMADSTNVVMDGRDIGTHVLPDAHLKIFLTASIEERALRRYNEMKAKGMEVKLEELIEQIRRRDEADSQREVAPLVPAADAIILDTTHMEIDRVVQWIIDKLRETLGE